MNYRKILYERRKKGVYWMFMPVFNEYNISLNNKDYANGCECVVPACDTSIYPYMGGYEVFNAIRYQEKIAKKIFWRGMKENNKNKIGKIKSD